MFFAKKVEESPIGPHGEFMTYGHCIDCKKYDAIYLRGTQKGRCGRCVKPTLKARLKRLRK